MTLNNVTTLEDLREYLSEKFETEWKNLPTEDILKKQDVILSMFELSSEEYDYAAPLTAVMEDQSAKKTIINTSKAKAILVKRK
jgi:C4-type Zn-finger protein